MKFNYVLTVLLLLPLIAGCAGPGTASNLPPEPDYWPTAGWRTSTPEEQGMDSEQLAQMLAYVDQQRINLHSLLVVRNGYLVTEAYFQPYNQDIRHEVQSVTKTFIGALVGVAIEQGKIRNVNQKVVGFFPDLTIYNLDAKKKALTLEDLLTLQPGLVCNDFPGAEGLRMQDSSNWVRFILNQAMEEDPGVKFNYCSAAVHLVSGILQRATGMNTRDFANEYLLAPLGIQPMTQAEWPDDPQGVALGGWGMTLYPRDMAKVGLLYLNGGRWDGRQILPADYAAAAVQQHATKENGDGYGYLWTVFPGQDMYAALGLAGQYVIVLPKQNIAVVMTSGVNDMGYDSAGQAALFGLVENYVLKAVQADGPLPANPSGVAQLQERLQYALNPARPVPALPAIAQEVSGALYQVAENSNGWQTLSFAFQDGADTAQVVINGAQTITVGLDNVYRLLGGEGFGAMGLRGYWKDEDTFVAEQVVVGTSSKTAIELTFTGRQVAIAINDLVLGSPAVEMQGTRQK